MTVTQELVGEFIASNILLFLAQVHLWSGSMASSLRQARSSSGDAVAMRAPRARAS
jgi:hypothetical protein